MFEPIVRTLLAPGFYVLEGLGFSIDGPVEYTVAVLLSAYCYATVFRVAHFGLGKPFAAADHYHYYVDWTGWRFLYPFYSSIADWVRQRAYGQRPTARFALVLETLTALYRPGDIPLGVFRPWRLRGLQPIGTPGRTHLNVIARTGSGKSNWVISLLCRHRGNFLAFDCDGAITTAINRRVSDGGGGIIGMGKQFFCLDFFGLVKSIGSASWNCLEEITWAAERFGRQAAVRWAMMIAEALIREDNSHQPVFADMARSYLQGLILYVWLVEPPEKRNLIRVRELITRGLPEKAKSPKEDPQRVLWWEMMQIDAFDGVIGRAAGIAATAHGHDGKNHVLNGCMRNTKWLDMPEVAARSKHSDFRLADFKAGNIGATIVAPVQDVQTTLSGFFRLMATLTTYTFQNLPGDLKHSTALIWDEFPSLCLEGWETHVAGLRKYGARVILISQDIGQLSSLSDNWETYISSAEATIFMESGHQGTLEWLEKRLGTVQHREKVGGGRFSKVKPTYHDVERPLMYAHQLDHFLAKNVVVVRPGKRPLALKPIRYFKDEPVYHYDPSPYHRERLLRRIARAICRRLAQGRAQNVKAGTASEQAAV